LDRKPLNEKSLRENVFPKAFFAAHKKQKKIFLGYDKYFIDGDVKRNILTEFNSNNTQLLTVKQVKDKLLALQYIRNALEKRGKVL